MTLFEQALARVNADYAANLAALEAAKESIITHEYIANATGNTALCSVYCGRAEVWIMCTEKGYSPDINPTLTKPVRFVGHKPVYVGKADGVEFFFTEKD